MAGLADRFFHVLGLDAARQRALLRLRARLAMRQFEREPGRMVGFIVFLVIFGPLVLLLAAGSGFAYLAAPEPWPVQILGIVLSGLWLAWIMLPLFAFRTNEGLDLSRLLIFPLDTRNLIASALLGTLFDGPSYVTLPFFLAILIGWLDQPVVLIIVLLAIVIAYLQMIAAGQLVLTASMGLLRSRRFRDLTIVIFSLLGSSCYFINRGIEAWARAAGAENLIQLEPLQFLRWLPPGACAQAVASAGQGGWLEALVWLLYAVGWLALLIFGCWKLLLRMTTGVSAWSLPAATAKKPRRRRTSVSEGFAALWFAWLPTPVRAMMIKELKLIWRVPQRRIGLLQSVIAPFALIFAIFFGDVRALSSLPEWTTMGLPAIVLFSTWGLTTNMLGMESRGLATLLLTPAPRWQIFTGKGLAYAIMALLPTGVYALVLGLAARSPLIVFGLLAAVGTSLVVVAVNMVAAVYFTFPFDENSTTRQRSGGGFSTGIAQIVLTPLLMAIASAPTTLPIAIGIWLNQPALVAMGAVAGLVYAAGFFASLTRYAANALSQREADVLQAARLDR